MKKRRIKSNNEHWDTLARFCVQAEVSFDPAKLSWELRTRVREEFPDHAAGVVVERTEDCTRSYLTVTCPFQTIHGKTLVEKDVIRILEGIEAETLMALHQQALVDLVDR